MYGWKNKIGENINENVVLMNQAIYIIFLSYFHLKCLKIDFSH